MISTLIITCDKNVDLYPFMNHTVQQLRLGKINDLVIVGETNEISIDGSTFVYGETNAFGDRIIAGLNRCKNDYVFLLLDDYYVFDKNIEQKLNLYRQILSEHEYDYLRVSNDPPFAKKSLKNKNSELFEIVSFRKYVVNFHPSIWKKAALIEAIQKINQADPWCIESKFSCFCEKENKKSAICLKFLDYEELVIRGRFFRKPYKKIIKPVYKGNRKRIDVFHLFVFKFKRFFSNHLPEKVKTLLTKIFKIKRY